MGDFINRKPVKIINTDHRLQKEVEHEVHAWPSMVNKYDGREAIFPITSVGKVLNHKGYDISTIFNSIPFLFKTSECIISESETLRTGHRKHPNIIAYHHYLNKFYDSKNNEFFVRFTIHEEKSRQGKGKNYIHSMFVSDVNIYKKALNSNSTGIIAPGEEIKTPSDLKLLRYLTSVNNNLITYINHHQRKNRER